MHSPDDLMPPVSVLFPPRAERVQWDDYLTRELLCASERVADGSVVPTLDMARLRSELAEFDFATPRALDELLPWTIAQLEHGVVHMTNPRYFGLFNPAPSFPALCGDRITGVFNPQLATATTSPAAVEIESHVISAIARRVGLPPEATGHFTSGGSEANYTAVLCALTHANDRFALDGARCFRGQPVFYISRESHLAWVKIGHQAGIGRSAVRQVPTDGTGRMDVVALERMLTEDTARGCVPVLIVATAGTTNAGMIDPIERCAELARAHGLWLHVDAAYAGSAALAPEFRAAFAGCERADSFVTNPHKWMMTPMDCSVFYTRRPEVLRRAFSLIPEYLQTVENSRAVNLMDYGVPLGRRFRALKLWFVLRSYGREGIAEMIRGHVRMAQAFAALVDADPRFERTAPSPFSVVCFRYKGSDDENRRILDRVNATGEVFLSGTVLRGQYSLRLAVGNYGTKMQHVVRAWELVKNAPDVECRWASV